MRFGGAMPSPSQACGLGPSLSRWERGISCAQRDIRCILGFHADDIVTRIDMMDLAGHARSQVGEQVQPRAADILDSDSALQGRVQLVPLRI